MKESKLLLASAALIFVVCSLILIWLESPITTNNISYKIIETICIASSIGITRVVSKDYQN